MHFKYTFISYLQRAGRSTIVRPVVMLTAHLLKGPVELVKSLSHELD